MNLSPYIIPGLPKVLTENIRTENIFNAVIEITGILYPKLIKINRKREVVLARALCYYFLRWKAGFTLSDIGKMFNKDHTTVIHGLNLLKNLLETNDELATDWYRDIKTKLTT